jgi:DNA-binding NarL/FixJ family response regulator
MLAQFERRLPLLTGGRRDLPPRQRTMRDAIAWSYDLLSDEQKRLFRRLSVFAGGCSVPTAAAVGTGSGEGEEAVLSLLAHTSPLPLDVLDGLGSLVDKSLLLSRDPDSGEPRFIMFETIREFGLEMLDAANEEESTRRRHAACFLALAEQAKPELRGSDPAPWLARLEAEVDNFRAALRWAIDHDPTAEAALRTCSALWLFWQQRGYLSEAIQWLERALDACDETPSLPRADALLLLGHSEPDQAKSTSYFRQSLDLYRQLGDRRRTAGALLSLGMGATNAGEYGQSSRLLEESLAIFTELDNDDDIAQARFELGKVAAHSGELAQARRHLDEARSLWQRLGDAEGVAFALLELGRVYRFEGRFADAENLLAWSLERFQATGFREAEVTALRELGVVMLAQHNVEPAFAHLRGALALSTRLGIRSSDTLATIEALARAAHLQGQHPIAIRLWAATTTLRKHLGTALSQAERTAREQDLAAARSAVGALAYENAWTSGSSLSIDDAMAEAQLIEARPAVSTPASPPQATAPFGRLTNREQEVLCLLADGFSNQAIADALHISIRTVTTHVEGIFEKFAVDNRAAAAAHAVRLGICT